MRQWTYDEITQACEREIDSILRLAERQQGSDETRNCRSWAYGAYLCWNSLTMGWQKEGDAVRIKLLAEGTSD